MAKRISRWLGDRWSRWLHPVPRRRWRITGWAVGFAPQAAVSLYIDGHRVAIFTGHELDHVELIMQSRQQPQRIYLTGASLPGGPAAQSSFVVQELPPR
jgi:hypothetical protein